MITVRKALYYDVCTNFRLVSGENGLNNRISVVGFFEWEDGEKLITSFIQGTFVLTTLSMFQGDIQKAERSLRLMMNNGVSGIAIKDIFFQDISDELKQYANARHIPIFFFSETYINKIIYVLQNAVEDDRKYSTVGRMLAALIKEPLTDAQQEQRLGEINPHLRSEKMTVFFFSDEREIQDSEDDLMKRYEPYIFQLEMLMRTIPGYENIVYSIANYQRGFFLLFHETKEDPLQAKEFMRLLRRRISDMEELSPLFIGVCEGDTEASAGKKLQNAIFANVRGILNHQKFCFFSEIGFDYVIFDNLESEAAKKYYEDTCAIIREAETNHTPFFETLLAYVQSNGNADVTAEKLHQHRNTVRYRIEKMRKLLGNDEEIIFIGKLAYFIRMYQARPYLKQLI